jgi:hypothetical protein
MCTMRMRIRDVLYNSISMGMDESFPLALVLALEWMFAWSCSVWERNRAACCGEVVLNADVVLVILLVLVTFAMLVAILSLTTVELSYCRRAHQGELEFAMKVSYSRVNGICIK